MTVDDFELAAQQVHHAVFTLPTPAGVVTYMPHVGCLPGDPVVVELWVTSTGKVMVPMQEQCHKDDPHSGILVAKNPSGHVTRLDQFDFVDDVLKLTIEPCTKADGAAAKVAMWHSHCNATFKDSNQSQKMDKMSSSRRSLVGQPSRSSQPVSNLAAGGGNGVDHEIPRLSNVRCCGNQFTGQHEADCCHQIGVCFVSQCFFASSPLVHGRTLVYVSDVRSHSASRFTAFCWRESNRDVIESQTAMLLRSVMQGKATEKNEEGEVLRSVTDKQICKRYRFL